MTTNEPIIELSKLQIRILMAVDSVNTPSPTSVTTVLMRWYRKGIINRRPKFNYICIMMRELREMRLLESKVINKHSFGRTSYYSITEYGREQLLLNTRIEEIDDNNSSVVVLKGNLTIITEGIERFERSVYGPLLLLSILKEDENANKQAI